MTRPLAKILIADRYDVVRRGVRQLVEEQGRFHVTGEAATGRDAFRLALETSPTIVILDYGLPELNGFELTYQLRSHCPQTEILIYTELTFEPVIFDMLQAGARGLVLKTDSADNLVMALDALSLHQPYFSAAVSEVLLERFLNAPPESASECLTHREREVVQLVAEGRMNKQIAHRLKICLKTVETHRASAMRKLNANTTADLVRYAIRNNIILP